MEKRNLLNLFAILLIVVAGSLGCKSNASNAPSTEKADTSNSSVKTENTETPMRSGKIMEAFIKNKDANRIYRGKTFLISGKITNINNVFDQVNINLRENENEQGLAAYLKNVEDKQRLKIGDEVIIRGFVRDDEHGIVEKAEIVKIN